MSSQRKIHPMVVARQKNKSSHGWKHRSRWRQRRKALLMETNSKATVPGLLELFRETWDIPGTFWKTDLERAIEIGKGMK